MGPRLPPGRVAWEADLGCAPSLATDPLDITACQQSRAHKAPQVTCEDPAAGVKVLGELV